MNANMASLPEVFNESTIIKLCNENCTAAGRVCAVRGRVHAIAQRGDSSWRAFVHADAAVFVVSVVFVSDDDDAAMSIKAHCSCSTAGDEHCEHVAATLFALLALRDFDKSEAKQNNDVNGDATTENEDGASFARETVRGFRDELPPTLRQRE